MKFWKSFNIIVPLLMLGFAPLTLAGVGAGGGGDPKAIEFLSYAKSACRWMSSSPTLQIYSQECSSNVADIYASLGDYNRTARLEFVLQQLQDQNGVSKPLYTSSDGRVHVNQIAWISMTIEERVRAVAMEMSVLCGVKDRYSIGDQFGKAWDLAHRGDRPLSEIPVGTKLLGYVPIIIPANSDAIDFTDKLKTVRQSFTEIFTAADSFTEVDDQKIDQTNDPGHIYSLGAIKLRTQDEECLSSYNSNSEQRGKGYKNCMKQAWSPSTYEGDMGSYGILVLMPSIENQDISIQNLTITAVHTSVPYVVNSDDVGATTRSEVVLDAVTDLNPNNVIKIVAHSYTNFPLTLSGLERELQRHFALIFPEPKAE